ncbi:MAG: hypothetical protein ACYDCQ_00465 [Dehalococcoidia bacterium]
MTAEPQPLDITNTPELSRVADDVRHTGRPRVWRRGGKDIAVLVPIANAVRTPPPYNPALAAVLEKLPKDSIVARTAGSLHTDQPFPGYDQEREAAALAMARDYAVGSEE